MTYPEITEKEARELAERLRNDPSFKDEFLAIPTVKNLAHAWLNAPRRTEKDDSTDTDIKVSSADSQIPTEAEALEVVYEIIVWDMKNNDAKRTIKLDRHFWESARILVTKHTVWTTSRRGEELANLFKRNWEAFWEAPEIDKKIRWRINRLNIHDYLLGLTKEQNRDKDDKEIDKICRELENVFFQELKADINAKILSDPNSFLNNNPGDIVGYLHTILYNYHWDSRINNIQEEFHDLAKRDKKGTIKQTFSHLTLSVASKRSLETKFGKHWYEDFLEDSHRLLVEKYYKNELAQNNKSFNDAIKKEINRTIESKDETMVIKAIGFDYNTKKEYPTMSYSVEASTDLKRLLPKYEVPDPYSAPEDVHPNLDTITLGLETARKKYKRMLDLGRLNRAQKIIFTSEWTLDELFKEKGFKENLIEKLQKQGLFESKDADSAKDYFNTLRSRAKKNLKAAYFKAELSMGDLQLLRNYYKTQGNIWKDFSKQ